MKFRIWIVGLASLLMGCVSWVFAESAFDEMPAGTYELDKTHASIVWKVSHLGLSDYTALFTDFDANIDFNPDDISQSKVTATINPLSIQTHYPHADEKDFNNILATDKKWFNVGAFPNITFESTTVELTSPTTATMTGNMSMLGVSKPVTFDVTFNGAMKVQPFSRLPTLGVSARTVIKRSEWGMDNYVPNIGDEVEVLIEAEFGKP